jgi:hypothetical protein
MFYENGCSNGLNGDGFFSGLNEDGFHQEISISHSAIPVLKEGKLIQVRRPWQLDHIWEGGCPCIKLGGFCYQKGGSIVTPHNQRQCRLG